MTDLNLKIITTVNRARSWWALMMAITAVAVLFAFPFWYLFFLIPFGVVTYMTTLAIAAAIISRTITPEEFAKAQEERALLEIREALATGDHDPEEVIELMKNAGFTDVVVVEDMGPIIGNFKDLPIYEYVLVKSPGAEEAERFNYHGPADVVDGMPQIPVIDGMLFTHVQGIIYSKSIQPA